MSAKELHPDLVREFLFYDPRVGTLTWRRRDATHFKSEGDAARWNTRYAGTEAFTSEDDKGYYQGTLDGRRQLKHRVIMAHVLGYWPRTPVDHEDGNKKNNRLANLRLTTTQGNQRNQPRSSRNRSGVVGVSWDNRSQKWRAELAHRHLGLFADLGEATEIRRRAQEVAGFHRNHGR